jgi:hypothetical protein
MLNPGKLGERVLGEEGRRSRRKTQGRGKWGYIVEAGM